MRDFNQSGKLCGVRPVPASILALAMGCNSPTYLAITAEQDALSESSGSIPGATEGTSGATPTSSSAGEGTEGVGDVSDAGGTSTGAGFTSDGAASTSSGGGDGDSSSGGALPPPVIVDVDMPDPVELAGPAPFTAITEYATSARARLDGVDIGMLQDEGGGVFSGVVAIFGAVDNGAHVLEVIAEREDLADQRSVPFEVSTPAPGTAAWAMAGPVGSSTRRISLTPEGDVIEVGTLVIAGAQRPVIRKRSGVTGAEQWAEGTIVLDDREGWAADVAVAPDGGLWVAMNVREAANKWRPRIALLDAAGHFTGVEVPAEAGQTVTSIDNDGTGGCVAAGFAGTGLGDTDVLVWRVNGDHVPVLSGKPWDYQPADKFPHKFTDIATDVVVQDGVVWIVGMSVGQHDNIENLFSRGFILRMDLATAGVLGPIIIAPPSGSWKQSKFFGAVAHPDGIVVTGNACDAICDTQHVETALYTAVGARPWFRSELPSTVAYGSAVALDAHDGVAVAVTMRDGAALRGFLLGRVVYDQATPFSVPFPASKEDSEASGIAIDSFDQLFGAGYRTFGDVTEARVVRAHK